MDTLAAPLLDLPAWQAVLDAQREVFDALEPGAAIGFVPRSAREAALPGATPVEMLVWERGAEGMTASTRTYRGLKHERCDLLFFCEPDALAAVLASAHESALGEMKRRIRAGSMLMMVVCARDQLLDRGYEDLLELLGLPFIGACR